MRTRSLTTLLAAILVAVAAVTPGMAPAAAAMPSPAATAPAADILTYRGDAMRDGTMPGPGPMRDATVDWLFQASGPINSQVMVGGGMVYLVSGEGTLRAIDLATGTEHWSAALGARPTGSPLLLDGQVLVPMDDGLRAVSMTDGTLAWKTSGTHPLSTPALTGGRVVVSAEDGTVSAVDPATGAIAWSTDIGAGVDTSPAATEDTVVVGTRTGQVVALSAVDGTVRWHTDTGDGARVGTPAISDGRVYIATLDGGGPKSSHIRALDLATGAVLWTFDSPDGVPSYTPSVVDGLAITEGESGAVTALDATTGAMIWQSLMPGLVETVPAVADGVVYGASNDGVAFGLDAATGASLWQVPIKGVPYGAAVTGGLMLVGTNVGRLYAIGGSQR